MACARAERGQWVYDNSAARRGKKLFSFARIAHKYRENI